MNKKLRTVSIQTQYGCYQCTLESENKHGFIVTVPGLPGVITWGKNITHTKEMAKEAIELCIECRVEETLHKTKTKRGAPARELVAI